MNDLERAEQPSISKFVAFMVFLQVISGAFLLMGIFNSLLPVWSNFLILMIVLFVIFTSLLSIFTVWLSAGYRAFVGGAFSHTQDILKYLYIGYYFYYVAAALSFITLIFFIFNKKLYNKNTHRVASFVMLVITILMYLVHKFVVKA